jgi:monothiol glutaredoxin
MPLDDTLHSQISDLIAQHEVLLFMKGSPEQPQCGFSAKTVEILDFVLPTGTHYGAVDVLSDPAIREGIKEFSNWPTVPQLYVKGAFIGGCDIVKEMFQNGELFELFGLEKPETVTPTITITDSAAEKIREAMGDQKGQCLAMQIDASFQNSMRFIPDTEDAEAGVKVTSNGLSILFDPISSQRADGLTIDFVTSEEGEGFTVDNPNAPPVAKEISVQQLKQKLDAAEKIEIFDVRSPEEQETAALPSTRSLDDEAEQYIGKLDRDTPLYFICHHGSRSMEAANYFRAKGFRDVSSITGGIDAWSLEIDSSVPRY